MLIDSHCHLHDRQFFTAEEAEKILEKSRQNGVEKIVCIGTDPEDSLAARDFAKSHENVYWTYGVHPEEWEKWSGEKSKSFFFEEYKRSAALEKCPCGHFSRRVTLEKKKLLDFSSGEHVVKMTAAQIYPRSEKNFSHSLVAIGEVGLDYHSEGYNRPAQIKLFNEMLQLATDLNLPVSFHIRNAFDDFFGIINNFPKLRGVVHSFTDSKKNLKKILETTDFYVGVNGLATYSTLPTPPLDRILLETDAPFLTPVPYRGEKNDPSHIKDIALWLAKKLSTPDSAHPISLEEIADITSKNANNLFHFS